MRPTGTVRQVDDALRVPALRPIMVFARVGACRRQLL